MDVLGKFSDAPLVCASIEIAREEVRKKNGAAIASLAVNQEYGMARAEQVCPAAIGDADVCGDRYGIRPHQPLYGQIP